MLGPAVAPTATASNAASLSRDSRAALEQLYRQNPTARDLGSRARAVLVFPSMLKAGFMFGGQIGEGALLKGGRIIASGPPDELRNSSDRNVREFLERDFGAPTVD